MKKFVLALLFFLVVDLLFFLPSIWGVFVAGDYGGSDFTDFFLPVKFYLASALKEKRFPLWSRQMGAGFPLLSEGQMATFFPTTILYFLLPFHLALNLNFLLPLFFASLSFYLFLQTFNLSFSSCLFGAFAFSFSPSLILHLKHPSLTWITSFFPLELTLLSLFLRKERRIFFLLFSLLVGLKFLAGSPQMALFTSFVSYFFFLFQGFGRKKFLRRALIEEKHLRAFFSLSGFFLFFFLLGIALASIQLFPTLSLWLVSERKVSFPPEELRRFSLIGKSLTTFLLPYSLENPVFLPAYFEKGKYPFFWETNLYCGLLPLFSALFGFLFLRRKRIISFFFLLFLFSLLLSFGPHTPLGFLFRLPLFFGFRVPGRFTFFVTFSLIFISSFFFDFFFQRLFRLSSLLASFLILLSLFFLLADYFWFWGRYNISLPLSVWQKTPFSVSYLQKVKAKGRIYSFATAQAYNFIFVYNRGWGRNPKNFLSYQELIPPNSNLYYQLPSTTSYAGMRIGESLVFTQLLFNLASSFQNPLSQKAFLHLLALSHTKYLLSPFEFNHPQLKHIFTSRSPYPELTFKLYKIRGSLPRVFIVPKAKFLSSSLAVQTALLRPDFDPRTLVFIEEPNRWGSSSSVFGSIAEIVKDDEERIVIKVNLTARGFLVVADTYFPNWKVKIDGREGEILRANLKFRAVPLSPGEHLVEFFYQPSDLEIGAKVSFLAFLLWILLLRPLDFNRTKKVVGKVLRRG